MVQKRQYDILKQGIGEWNNWRKTNPAVTPDLTLANLSGVDLVSANLAGANLAGANLSAARLDRATLAHADLKGANLSYASLTRANLTDANLSNTDLRYAQLHGTLLVCANLTGADISSARLEKTDTTKWIITNIRCTEILKNGETIYFEKGQFETAFTQPERMIQIILNVPKSVLTHHIGQLIEVYFNRYFGGIALAYKGQESLSNIQTAQKYVLLKESDEEKVKNRLEMVRTGISFIMENDETREMAKRLAGFSATVANLSGDVSQDQQTVSNALDKQHAAMKPLLHKTVRAIHKVLKSSPA